MFIVKYSDYIIIKKNEVEVSRNLESSLLGISTLFRRYFKLSKDSDGVKSWFFFLPSTTQTAVIKQRGAKSGLRLLKRGF